MLARQPVLKAYRMWWCKRRQQTVLVEDPHIMYAPSSYAWCTRCTGWLTQTLPLLTSTLPPVLRLICKRTITQQRVTHLVIFILPASSCSVRPHPVAVPGALYARAMRGRQVLYIALVTKRTP